MKVTEPKPNMPVAASKWLSAMAIPIIGLGILAILFPLFSTLTSASVFGWVFIGAGVGQLIYASQSKGAGQIIWKLILGLLYLFSGIFVVANPLKGVLAFTLVLGITIFVQGMIQVALAFQLRRTSANWGWILISGIVGIICGVLVWSSLPSSAAWLIGTLIGVNLLFDGIWMLTPHSEQRLFEKL